MQKKINAKVSICCLSLLLSFNFVASYPVSGLQSIEQLLEEVNASPNYSSEEMAHEEKELKTSEFGAPDRHPWESSDPSNSALTAEENVVTLLLKDIMRTSKRSSNRYKKGGLRSCFGVRLERIGSFSGLGC